MLNVDELLAKVDAYQRNRISLKDFDHWFEDQIGERDATAEVNQLRLAIDAALAAYYFDHIGETAFQQELAKTIRPFVKSPAVVSLDIREHAYIPIAVSTSGNNNFAEGFDRVSWRSAKSTTEPIPVSVRVA